MIQDPRHDELLDEATRSRLAKLRSRPVDTSRLQRRLAAMIDPAPPQRRATFGLQPWTAWAGLAAAVIVFAAVSMWPIGSHGRVEASTVQMLQLHNDIVSGRLPVAPTDNVGLLRQVIWSRHEGPQGIGRLPEEVSRSCCFRDVSGRSVVGLLWDAQGHRISIAVGNGHRMGSHEMADTVQRGEFTFTVHHRDGVNMAMTTVNGRLLCFMSDLPGDRLIDLALQVLNNP